MLWSDPGPLICQLQTALTPYLNHGRTLAQAPQQTSQVLDILLRYSHIKCRTWAAKHKHDIVLAMYTRLIFVQAFNAELVPATVTKQQLDGAQVVQQVDSKFVILICKDIIAVNALDILWVSEPILSTRIEKCCGRLCLKLLQVMDQHAADERVLLEQLLGKVHPALVACSDDFNICYFWKLTFLLAQPCASTNALALLNRLKNQLALQKSLARLWTGPCHGSAPPASAQL